MSGFPAWWAARTYHVSQIPGLARKLRAVADWTVGLPFPRDTAEVGSIGHPAPLRAEIYARGGSHRPIGTADTPATDERERARPPDSRSRGSGAPAPSAPTGGGSDPTRRPKDGLRRACRTIAQISIITERAIAACQRPWLKKLVL